MTSYSSISHLDLPENEEFGFMNNLAEQLDKHYISREESAKIVQNVRSTSADLQKKFDILHDELENLPTVIKNCSEVKQMELARAKAVSCSLNKEIKFLRDEIDKISPKCEELQEQHDLLDHSNNVHSQIISNYDKASNDMKSISKILTELNG